MNFDIEACELFCINFRGLSLFNVQGNVGAFGLGVIGK